MTSGYSRAFSVTLNPAFCTPYRYASVFKGCLTLYTGRGGDLQKIESKCYLGKVEAQAKLVKFVFCRRQHEAVLSCSEPGPF